MPVITPRIHRILFDSRFSSQNLIPYLPLALILSYLALYIGNNQIEAIASISVIILILTDLSIRLKFFIISILNIESKKLKNRSIFFLYLCFVSSIIIAFIRGALLDQNGSFYPDALFNVALVAQIRGELGERAIFGIDPSIEYYLGVFALFGIALRFWEGTTFELVQFFCIPYLIFLIILSVQRFIDTLAETKRGTSNLLILMLVICANGNFLLQPNFDDRLPHLLPVVSISQMIGLVLYFDLLTLWSSKSQSSLHGLKLFTALYLISAVFTKPSMLIPMFVFWYALALKKKHGIVILVSVLIIILIGFVWQYPPHDLISLEIDLPSFTNPMIYLWIAVLLLAFSIPIDPRVELLRKLVGLSFSIQVFLIFFDIREERGLERWIVDPIFATILIYLLSNIEYRSQLCLKFRFSLVAFFILYFIDSILELLRLDLSRWSYFLVLVITFIQISYISLKTNICTFFADLKHLEIAGIKQILAAFGSIALILSFNPFILIDSLSLVKKNNVIQGISISYHDYKELKEIRKILSLEGEVSVVFSNRICRDHSLTNTVKIDRFCDVRTNLVSAFLEKRSPFEYAKFGLSKNEMDFQNEILVIDFFSQSLESAESFNQWNRTFMDSVFFDRRTRFLLIDKSIMSKIPVYGDIIFVGKRFEIFKLE